MTRLRCILLAIAASIAAPAFAQEPAPRPNIAGDWDVTVQSPQGTNTVLVTLKQDGEKVDGLFKSPLGELPFTGTLVGNELKFNFSFPVDGQPLLITMTGKIDGEAIAGKADFGGFAEGDWSAKRATANAAATPASTATTTTTTTTMTTTAPTATTTTAGGFGGKWDVMLKTPGGDFPANATLTDEGGKVSGTFGSQMGEVPVNGTVEGKALKITMVAQTPQGAMNVTMTGDLDGDAIVNGKADIEGMGQMEWTAKRVKQ
jgi:hypothetical protein